MTHLLVYSDSQKFLVVDGKPVERYLPTTAPSKIEADIVAALDSTKSEL